jgi:hypothetical protein
MKPDFKKLRYEDHIANCPYCRRDDKMCPEAERLHAALDAKTVEKAVGRT